jgi:hypothetical protein
MHDYFVIQFIKWHVHNDGNRVEMQNQIDILCKCLRSILKNNTNRICEISFNLLNFLKDEIKKIN